VAWIKQLLLSSVMLSIQLTIFYFSAGQAINARSWLFFIASLLHYVSSVTAQYWLNPELLIQRLRVKREGSKTWDEVLMRVSNLTVLILIPLTAGLDVGRYYWSTLDIYYVGIGLVFFALSTVLINWAMWINPFFEPTVRIQKDRGHTVISGGPYKIVRHPGYLGGILYTLSAPLIIGSLYTFIPVAIYVLLIMLRTLLEDRTLQRELEGYSEYTKQTKYRLFPWIW